MKHPEGGGERRPQSTIDRVLERELYANLRFPRVGFATNIAVLATLVQSEDVKSALEDYLPASFPEPVAQAMLAAADKVHRAYLPADKIPQLSLEDMRPLWDSDKHRIQEVLLYFIGEKYSNTGEKYDFEAEGRFLLEKLEGKQLPVAELRAVASAVLAAFEDPAIKAELTAYRDWFRTEYWKIEDEEARQTALIQKVLPIQEAAFSFARRSVAASGFDEHRITQVFDVFEKL